MLDFIIWDIVPELFTIPEFSLLGKTFGPLAPRWYGLLFAAGFIVGQYILSRIYKIENRTQKEVDTITVYMIVATLVGARLGHCLFYEPDYFLQNPIEILFVWQGGLASHGATVGILFGIWLYCRKNPGFSYLKSLDRIVICIALGACFIRLGNLMNSEIIGTPTTASQGFIFANSTTTAIKEEYGDVVSDVKIKSNGTDTLFNDRYMTGLDIRMKVKSFGNGNIKEMAERNIRETIYGDREYGEHIMLSRASDAVMVGTEGRDGTTVVIKAWGIPRHPSQLYESISCLILFFFLLFLYSRFKTTTPEGLLLGVFMVWVFTLRFFYEFIKENQVAFENDMTYNMGQLLSIPLILIGTGLIVRSLMLKKATK